MKFYRLVEVVRFLFAVLVIATLAGIMAVVVAGDPVSDDPINLESRVANLELQNQTLATKIESLEMWNAATVSILCIHDSVLRQMIGAEPQDPEACLVRVASMVEQALMERRAQENNTEPVTQPPTS